MDSYENSLPHEKLNHKKFKALTQSSLAPSSGPKIEKWVKKCYFSKTFNKILKLIFFETGRCKNAEIKLKKL